MRFGFSQGQAMVRQLVLNVFLRDMLSSDSETVLRWRNDPETRRNSFNRAQVLRLTPAPDVSRVLADQPRRNFIADIDDSTYEDDWSSTRGDSRTAKEAIEEIPHKFERREKYPGSALGSSSDGAYQPARDERM